MYNVRGCMVGLLTFTHRYSSYRFQIVQPALTCMQLKSVYKAHRERFTTLDFWSINLMSDLLVH
jgi:hypothetical protein